MARKLSVRQKKVIKTLVNVPNIFGWNDFPTSIQNELESINFYETLWSDAQRFLSDEKVNTRQSSSFKLF